MIYTEEQLFTMIKPMVATAINLEEKSEATAQHLTESIIEVIRQDREAIREGYYDKLRKTLDDIEIKLVIHNKTATKEEILMAAKKAVLE